MAKGEKEEVGEGGSHASYAVNDKGGVREGLAGGGTLYETWPRSPKIMHSTLIRQYVSSERGYLL